MFPLVLGVTGHRDLRPDDEPKLRQRVLDILHLLKRRYPHTPFVLLSPLATGADCLVASAALDEGAELVVPLPMPRDEYERDFDDVSRQAFCGLLDRAKYSFTLPLLSPLHQIHDGGEARDRQYEQVGAYIAQHSQILIALWDGRHTNLMGGTSRIVDFQLHGVPAPYAPPHSPLDQLETGLVYQIITPRQKDPAPLGSPFAVHLLLPKDTQEADEIDDGGGVRRALQGETVVDPSLVPPLRYDHLFDRLDIYNRDAAQLTPTLLTERERSRSAFPPAQEAGIEAAEFERIVEACVTADVLAIRFARSTRQALIILGIVVGLAVIFIDAYDVSKWIPAAVLAPAALLFAFIFWSWTVKRGDVQNKYLDYRALAEGLRVQCFWRLAGLPDCVSEHYLRKQKSELDWIRDAIRVVDIPRASQASGSNCVKAPPRLDLVLRWWVEEQRDWYERRTRQDRGRMKRGRKVVSGLFAFGLIVAVAAAILVALHPDFPGGTLLIVSTIPLAIAGIWEGIADKMAYADQTRQYHRMHQVFRQAAQVLRESVDQGRHEDGASIIRELGTEALTEHADWVILHRARPVEIPKG